MLVINRGLHQCIKIGDDITIKILRLYEWHEDGRKVAMVSIGIEAPPEIHIARDNMKNQRPKNRSVAGACASSPSA